MSLKTAEQIIEDKVNKYRESLRKALTTRSEYRSMGFGKGDIDYLTKCDEEEMEADVAEYRAELMTDLPGHAALLADTREHTFALLMFNKMWLPNCLVHLSGETSSLKTRDVYDSYKAWCGVVGVTEPYSLAKTRMP